MPLGSCAALPVSVRSSPWLHSLKSACPAPSLCLPPVQRNFEDVVVEKKGFKWVNERPDAKTENDEKWGWIGGKPGDYVVLGLDSRSSGDGAGAGASVGAFWRACRACGASVDSLIRLSAESRLPCLLCA